MEFLFQYADILITALLTGIGGYTLSSVTHKRNQKRAKSEHLRELYNEYAKGLNLLFDMAEDLIEFAESIHLEIYTLEVAQEFVKELDEAIKVEKEYTNILNNVNIKYDFEKTLGFENELEEYISKLNVFIEFLEKVKATNDILISDKELKYIEKVADYLGEREDIIYEKMQTFYSSQYLPKASLKKLRS